MDLHTNDVDRRAPGEGEFLRRVREFDWSSTPLGPLSAWPHSMRTALQVHETEIDHLRRLQDLSTRLVREDEDEDALLQDVVAAAVAITAADSGDLRLVGGDGTLALIASQGFEGGLGGSGSAVDARAVADEAARTARRIQVDDVSVSSLFDSRGHAALAAANLRALQSSPLISRDGRVVGVLSTQHRDGLPANATCCCSTCSCARPRTGSSACMQPVAWSTASASCAPSCTRRSRAC